MTSDSNIVTTNYPVDVDTSFSSPGSFKGTAGGVCNNCKGSHKNQPKHCSIKNGVFQDTCSNRHCGCRCRTHAIDKDGQLRKIKFVSQQEKLQ